MRSLQQFDKLEMFKIYKLYPIILPLRGTSIAPGGGGGWPQWPPPPPHKSTYEDLDSNLFKNYFSSQILKFLTVTREDLVGKLFKNASS